MCNTCTQEQMLGTEISLQPPERCRHDESGLDIKVVENTTRALRIPAYLQAGSLEGVIPVAGL